MYLFIFIYLNKTHANGIEDNNLYKRSIGTDLETLIATLIVKAFHFELSISLAFYEL